MTAACRPHPPLRRSFIGDNDDVNDMPRNSVTRTARLASLPLGAAGRTAVGLGKRLSGRPTHEVVSEIQQRTAEQLFSVLGQLKGGAMKVGQALSVFEAAMPEELAAPYREALTRLQDDAPPLPAPVVHKVLASQLGPSWRDHFDSFDDQPAAAASIGQVHRAVWADGRQVAVKIQYPGAGKALLSDLNQLSRLGRMFAVLEQIQRAALGEVNATIADKFLPAATTTVPPAGANLAALLSRLARTRVSCLPSARM